MHYDYGHLVGYHGMSYIKSNLPKVAIWRSNGFRISPHIAKKSTTLLFSGTFGHAVGWAALDLGSSPGHLAVLQLQCCLSRTGEHPKSKSTKPSPRGDGPPCMMNSLV